MEWFHIKKKKIIINQECRITFIRLNLYVKYIQTSEIVSNLLKQNIYHIAQLYVYMLFIIILQGKCI